MCLLSTVYTVSLCCLLSVFANERVLLKEVKVLTLRVGQSTTGRRSSAVPQLTCTGGSGGCTHAPSNVQCLNQGWDGYDVQWKCDADLHASVKFGNVIVSCEGFDYPDDPYILRGSCGLEYSLESVSGHGGGSYGSYGGSSSYNTSTPSAFSSFFSMIMFVGVVVFLLWLCSSNTSQQMPGSGIDPGASGYGGGYPGGSGGYPGGGGGGGSGGMGWQRPDDNNPPPYDGTRYRGGSGGFGSTDNASCGGGGARQQPQGPGIQPGFWSGIAAGGLMGYLMGGNRRTGYGGYNSPGYGGYDSHRRGWGGGGSSPFGGGGGGGFGGGLGGSRTASGFGGTRRR